MADKEKLQFTIEAIDNFSKVLDKLNQSLEKGNVEIKIKVNEASLKTSLDTAISKINQNPPSINVKINSKDVSKQLKSELSNEGVTVKVNQGKFKDSIDNAKKKLTDFISSIHKIVVTIDNDKLQRSIDSASKKIEKLTGKERKVKIDTDARKITTKLQNISGRLDTISKKGFTINGDIKTGNIESKIIRLATYINQLNSKDIAPKVDKGISEIVKLSTYMNQLGAKKLNPEIDVNIDKAKSGVQAIFMMLQDLKKEKYKIQLDTSDLTNKNSQLKTTANTLKNLASSLKTIKSKKINLDFKSGELGQIVKTIRNLNKELTSVKNNIIINIRVNDGDTITKLKEISTLLRDIKRNSRININTRGYSRIRGYGGRLEPNVGTAMAGWVQFLGRSSKGFGSFLEAMARVSENFMALGGTVEEVGLARASIGKLGVAMAVLTGITSTFAVGMGLAASSVQQFGNILITIGNAIYNALKPGIDLYKQQQSAIFSFTAALQSNGILPDGTSLRSMGAEGRNIARGISTELIERATFDAEMSALNLKEILTALQGVMPLLMQLGMSAEQAYEVTKGVAGVAKFTQLAPNQVLQEVRDLAQGSITARTSQVANALGITNEDLAQYKGNADELFEYLMGKFKEYSELLNEFEDTAVGRFQQLEERWANVAKNIVDEIAPQFKGLFESLIEETGRWVDKNGNYFDAIKGEWYNAKGEFLATIDDIKNAEEGYKSFGIDFDSKEFQLSEPLEKAKQALIEIIEYAAQTLDFLIAWTKEAFNFNDPIDGAKTIIERIIDLFATSVIMLEAIVGLIYKFKDQIIATAEIVLKLGLFLSTIPLAIKVIFDAVVLVLNITNSWISQLSNVKTLVLGIADAFSKIMSGDFSGAMSSITSSAVKAMDDWISRIEGSWDTLKEDWKNLGKLSYGLYEENPVDELKKLLDVETKSNGWFTNAINSAKNQQINKGDTKGKTAADLRGTPKEDTKALEKANKDAIKQSQKMLKEKLSELKNALSDALDDLKDVLEKNKIAYEEGFMSMKDYFTQKADIERQEAELKLAESMEELSAINESLFDNEYDRLKALHEVERNIRKYSKEVEKTTRQQKEVARNIAKATTAQNKLLQAYSKMLKQGSVLQNNNVQSSRVSSSSNVVSQSSLQSWASNNGISSDIVEEVVKQAVEKYGENADNYIKMTLAMMMQESGGNQDAISSAGAIGLMQLMPDTASGLGVDPYDWKENIAGGLIYIDELAKQFGWDVEKIIAAYNAGPQAVIDYGGTPPYEETQNHVNIVKGYYDELGSLGNQAVSIVDDTTSSIYDAIDIALRRDGYLGQTLENGRVACVEAGTKLGSYYSDAFKQAVERGILNTDVLDEFFDEIGIPSIPWDAGQLNAGDIIFFDGEEQNQHVMLFKGNGMLAGNFSSGNEGAGAVGEESLENYLNYYGLTPTHIRKTGVYGLSSNFGQSYVQGGSNLFDLEDDITDISKLPLEVISEVNKVMESLGITDAPIADTTQLAQEYRNAINKLTTDTINLQADHLSRITGNTEGILLKLYNDMFNDISKHRSGSDEDRAYLQARAYKFQDDYLDAVKSNIETALEFNLDDIERNAKLRNVDIYSGKYSFKDLTDKYYSYFTDVNNKNGLAGFIKQLEDLFVQYTNRGFLKEAVEIRERIEDAKKSLYEMFDSWIEQGQKYWDNAEAIFNATDRFTPTQREFAEREFNAYRAQREYADRAQKGNILETDYKKNIKELTTLNKLSQSLNKNSKEYAENQERINYLVSDTKRLETLIRENEQLKRLAELTSKMPDYLDDLKKTARDALDNGLTEFLTDGILEAESLGDALRDLAYNILKEIQQISAKWIVKDLMNILFGRFNTEEEMGQTVTEEEMGQTVPAYLQQGQQIIASITTGTQQVVNAITSSSQLRNGISGTQQLGLGAFSQPWEYSLLNPNSKSNYRFGGFNLYNAIGQRFDDVKGSIDNGFLTTTDSTNHLERSVVSNFLESQEIASVHEALERTNDSIRATNEEYMKEKLTSIDSNTRAEAMSSSSSGGGGGTTSFEFPLGGHTGLGVHGSMGIGSSIGSMISGITRPITQIVKSIAGEIADLLNSEVFGSLLDSVNAIFGSAGAQLAGVGFAVQSFIKGDRKEKLLSMIYIELQLIYQQLLLLASIAPMLGFSKGGVIKLAKGGAVYHNNGLVTGPGSSSSDSIPAMLSNGEAVLNAKAVKELGLNFINSVNNGQFAKIKAKLPHFASGGFIGGAYQGTARGMTDFAKNVGANVTTNNQMNIALVRDEREAMAHFMKSPQGQKILVDFQKGNGRVFSRFNSSF